ncbi:hypothetical protein JOC34_002611 [Virgibacillus halotolerans]|nr:hypothetical protein [Virgibacillus halotolerans]
MNKIIQITKTHKHDINKVTFIESKSLFPVGF